MIKVKVCGITNNEDAQIAVQYGAWALGFIFYKKSPRYVEPSKVFEIVKTLPPFVSPVGVFVNEEVKDILEICKESGISTIQLHGEESPEFCLNFPGIKVIKSFRVNEGFDPQSAFRYKVDCYLFDTYHEKQYGGSGKTFDWDLILWQNFEVPVILSGGLNAQNVREAISRVKPYAVDVSSSIEKTPGIKNHRLIKEFFQSVSKVDLTR